MAPAVFLNLLACHIQLRLAWPSCASAGPALPSVALCCAGYALSSPVLNSSVWLHPGWVTPLSVHGKLAELSALLCLQVCLKCQTILRHLANAPSNPLSRRDTVIVRCIMCATQGICSNGRLLAAATILRALSVPIVMTLSVIPHSLATSRNWRAHASAKCLSSVFTTPNANECSCQLSSIRWAVMPR